MYLDFSGGAISPKNMPDKLESALISSEGFSSEKL